MPLEHFNSDKITFIIFSKDNETTEFILSHREMVRGMPGPNFDTTDSKEAGGGLRQLLSKNVHRETFCQDTTAGYPSVGDGVKE